jgi:hypothetical protein
MVRGPRRPAVAPFCGEGGSHSGESELTEGFVQDDGNRIGKVEGAGFCVGHRNREDTIPVSLNERFGQTGGFASENDIIVLVESRLMISERSTLFNEPEARVVWERRSESMPIRPDRVLDEFPIIHAGPLQLTFVEREPHRFNKVQMGACGGTQSCDVARVGWDFGFNEDHMHGGSGGIRYPSVSVQVSEGGVCMVPRFARG